ncbi:LAFE_0B01332g1_1 [Lachancea fermentati]|uniref:LAFE_0B01332g1_1 n=1 Tax=Lachancea fermentati TaxID=4955 RepID=A0A1G4M7F7_LACFM|nr:LAFE_0B01332g1_1 [Lachancea fermentati]
MSQQGSYSCPSEQFSSPPRCRSLGPRPSFDQSPDSPPFHTICSSPDTSDSSIVEKLTSERYNDYTRTHRPFSSPIRSEPRTRRQAERRQQALEEKALKMRGGRDQMHLDVMKLQKESEQRALAEQAAEHSLNPDAAAELELQERAVYRRPSTNHDGDDDDEDEDELIHLLAEREYCEQLLQLEQQQIEDMLARFSIT